MRSIAIDPRKIASEYRSLSEIMAKIGDLRNGPADLVMGKRDCLNRWLHQDLVNSSDRCQRSQIMLI